MAQYNQNKDNSRIITVGINTILSMIVGTFGGLAGAVVTVDTQSHSIAGRIARVLYGEELEQISASVTGALCAQGGANVTVNLSGFAVGEEVQIHYRFIPSNEYADAHDTLLIGNDGKGRASHSWSYDVTDCPNDKYYPIDVVVYREHATKTTREDIYYETTIPTRNG